MTAALSAGAAALSITVLGAAFAVLTLIAWHQDHGTHDDELHDRRLLEELKRMERQPHNEQDET